MEWLKNSNGFTIVELLVVIVVVGVLAGLSLRPITDARAKGRDQERIGDLKTLSSRLEEYRIDKGGYPNTFTVATFPSIDPNALKDPNGVSIDINLAVASQQAAIVAADPDASTNYSYTAYPTGCGPSNCTGFVLKSFTERPEGDITNPYIITGVHNN